MNRRKSLTIILSIFLIIAIVLLFIWPKKEISFVRVKSYEENFIDSLANKDLKKPKTEINYDLHLENSFNDTLLFNIKYNSSWKITKLSTHLFADSNKSHVKYILSNENIVFDGDTIEYYDTIFNLKKGKFTVLPKAIFTNKTTFSSDFFKGKNKHSYLSFSVFYAPLKLQNNNYETDFELNGCIFKKGLLSLGDIEHKLLITDCISDSLISFIEKGDRFYTGTIFYDDLIFISDTITGKIDLSYTEFENNGRLLYMDSTLPDTLDMSNMKLSGKVDLSKAYPSLDGEKCEINLIGTDVSKINMDYTYFHLYIPENIEGKSNYINLVSITYKSLLDKFEKNNYQESYETLDKEYKDWQSQYDWQVWLSKHWWRYGYEKWRILIVTFVLIVLFSFLNLWKYHKLRLVYLVDSLDEKFAITEMPGVLNSIKRYLLILFYTGFIFFKFAIDFKNIQFNSIRYVILLIIQYTIGLACTGYLINWIIKG